MAGRGLLGDAGGNKDPPAGGLGVKGGLIRGARGGRGGRRGNELCDPDSSSDVEIWWKGGPTPPEARRPGRLPTTERELAPGREFDFSLCLRLTCSEGKEDELRSLRTLRKVESLDMPVKSRHRPNLQLLEISQLLPS